MELESKNFRRTEEPKFNVVPNQPKPKGIEINPVADAKVAIENFRNNLKPQQVINEKQPTNPEAFDWGPLAKILGYQKPDLLRTEQAVSQMLKEQSPHINRYAQEVGVSPRLVAAIIYVESFRNLTSPKGFIEGKLNASWFGQELLKIKGATSGVGQMSMIEQLACMNNLKDSSSPFYLGKKFEQYLTAEDYQQANTGREWIDDSGVHNKDYKHPDKQIKFIAVMLAQLQEQWKRAGFDISGSPEILATLYNLGFDKSKPHSDPKSGGSMNYVLGQIKNFGDAAKAWQDSPMNPEIKMD